MDGVNDMPTFFSDAYKNISEAYVKARSLFTTAPNPQGKRPEHNFNLDGSDIALVNAAIIEFKEKYRALRVIDDQIYRQLSYTLACYAAHEFFSSFFLNIATTLGGGYFYRQSLTFEEAHNHAFAEYNVAFRELLAIFNWVMEDRGKIQEKLHNATIQNLITAIGPMLSVNTIKVWTDDDLEPISGLVYGQTPLAEPFLQKLNELTSSSHELTPNYLLYGEKANGELFGAMQILAAKPLTNAGELIQQIHGLTKLVFNR